MQLSQQIAAQDLQLYYQIACKGRAELQLAVTQEQGFEMSVLRMLAFRPLQPNEVLVAHANSAVVESVQQTAIPSAAPETALQQDAQTVDVEVAFEDAAITQNAEPEFDDGNLSENAEESKPPVDSSQQSDQIVFDPSSDEVLFDLDEADEFNTQTHDDEPNSDDFLFDEIVPLDIETQK
jgi:DNA polymerase III subunit gamma/tau